MYKVHIFDSVADYCTFVNNVVNNDPLLKIHSVANVKGELVVTVYEEIVSAY